MTLKELIRDRRTIQTFTSEKVDDAVVKEALELSLWSLNHKLTFPWFYKIVGSAEKEEIADLLVEMKSKKSPLTDAVKASMRENFLTPSHYIAIGIKKSGDDFTDKENYATLACSMQIASLVLWEKGVGSKWTSSGFSTHAKTYEILGISSEEIQLEGGLMIGKAAKVPPPAKRPTLAEILR